MKTGLVLLFLLAASCIPNEALDPRAYAVDVQVQTDSSGRIIFSWPFASKAREYVIRRKSINDQSWQGPIAVLPGNSTGFTDSGTGLGQAYEYEIQMATSYYPWPDGDPQSWVNAYTYVYAGANAPLEDYQGKVLLLVDNTIAGSASSELTQFQQDLIGSGWNVIRRDVSPQGSVSEIKNIIKSEYNADPGNLRSVILLGHVPVPFSGNINPDLHPSHKGAWPADGFYGELDGWWTDNTVSIRSEDSPENNNFPGDGKYDQSQFPSAVELEIGRIDFSRMTSFQPRSHADLLRNYLRKDHNFRHRNFTLPRRGLIRDNFGDLDGDAPAVDAWRHFGIFFSPGNAQAVGPNEFFSALNNNAYLWAYGCGGGGYKKADTIGSTPDFANNNPKAAFLILHGSYFGDWDNEDNFLRASIASQDYTLVGIWSGLPHWYMHHMALGKTAGYSTRISQNNTGLYKSHRNFSAGQVHVSLIGDPTLTMFPVIPPANLGAQSSANGVSLSWGASNDENIAGYHIYYATSPSGPYQRVTQSPVSSTSYTHSIGVGMHYYMVRAVKLERSGSGTFYNASQGVFASVNKTSGGGSGLPVVSVTVDDGDAAEAGPNPGTFKISRNDLAGTPLVVSLSIGGSASNGADYTAVGNTATIPAWSGAAYVTIYPITDAINEGDENVTITINASAAYQIGSGTASLVIRDNPTANQRPTISAIPDQQINAGGHTGDIPFTIGDAETPAASLSVRAGSSNEAVIPAGNIVLGGSGASRTVRVSAPAGALGSAKITVTVSDGSLEGSQNFFVTVTQGNSAPIANSQQITLNEDTSVPVTLSGSDPEGSPLQFIVLTNPLKGSLSGTPPNLIFTPALNENGTDSFTFKVRDGSLDSAPATVTLTITPVNDPPSIGVIPNAAFRKNNTFGPIGFIVQDPESNAGALILSAISDTPSVIPNSGILFSGSGSNREVKITPAANMTGSARITVVLSDGQLTGQTSFLVLVTNTPPVARTDSFSTLANRPLSISTAALLQNDSDADGDKLSITAVTPSSAAGGSAKVESGGILYTPKPGFSGTDSFSYTLTDTSNGSVQGLVEISVLPEPRISNIEAAPAQKTKIQFIGLPNRAFEILASTDAQNWAPIGQGTSDSNGQGEFIDSAAPEKKVRLYRVEWP